MTAPARPALRYHGGKWRLAPWIIGHFPAHRAYVEPFGGAASVLLQKPRCYAEIYNDMDGSIVNVFRVLRDPETAEQLRQALYLTPFAREEFKAAHKQGCKGVEAARCTIIRSFMGFGSDSTVRNNVTGFRANSNRSHTTPAHDWRNWPAEVPAFVDRLRGVVIESRPAADIIAQHDSSDTLFYLDPPYPASTRGSSRRHGYLHEMTDAQHCETAEIARNVVGMVIISGYACDMYAELYAGWHRTERETHADGAKPRTEVLWCNHACQKALVSGARQRPMFEAVSNG